MTWEYKGGIHIPLYIQEWTQTIRLVECSMVTFFYLISTFFFEHFLPGIIGLRCRMVTFFYLGFTFFFEHFLQTSDIGWLHPHKDTSQTVYKLLADI